MLLQLAFRRQCDLGEKRYLGKVKPTFKTFVRRPFRVGSIRRTLKGPHGWGDSLARRAYPRRTAILRNPCGSGSYACGHFRPCPLNSTTNLGVRGSNPLGCTSDQPSLSLLSVTAPNLKNIRPSSTSEEGRIEQTARLIDRSLHIRTRTSMRTA